MPTEPPTTPPPDHRRVDLRRLPHGLGYGIALLVAIAVIALAYAVSLGNPAPKWWWDYAVPVVYWSSPFLVLVAIIARIRRRNHDRNRTDIPPK